MRVQNPLVSCSAIAVIPLERVSVSFERVPFVPCVFLCNVLAKIQIQLPNEISSHDSAVLL